MTAVPNVEPSSIDPIAGESRPAGAFLRQMQVETGALAAATPPSDTSNPGGTEGSAAGVGGGGKSPAPSSAVPGAEQILQALEKVNSRLDAQGQFLQKVSGTLAQTRQEFETRYKAPARQPNGQFASTDEEPPPMDAQALVQTISQGVLAEIGEQLRPLVEQTTANSAVQRIQQAQYDPAVRQMVDELPPQVRASLAKEVHRLVGNKMFEERDPMFDSPDPVNEAIEMIHYRTVVKAGVQAGGKSPEPSVARQPFSPVPDQGARNSSPTASDDEQLTEQMFGVKLGPNRMRYPEAIERERGLG